MASTPSGHFAAPLAAEGLLGVSAALFPHYAHCLPLCHQCRSLLRRMRGGEFYEGASPGLPHPRFYDLHTIPVRIAEVEAAMAMRPQMVMLDRDA